MPPKKKMKEAKMSEFLDQNPITNLSKEKVPWKTKILSSSPKNSQKLQIKSGFPVKVNKKRKLSTKSEKKCKLTDIRKYFELKKPKVPTVPPGSCHAQPKTKANSTSAINTHMHVLQGDEEKGSDGHRPIMKRLEREQAPIRSSPYGLPLG